MAKLFPQIDIPYQQGAMLEIQNLHAYYGHSHALQGVNLKLNGKVHAVIGRNGMGKTTLCNCIMGLISNKKGSIRYRGQEISKFPPHKIASHGIAYTPQGRRLWAALTVDEHISLFSKPSEIWNRDEIYNLFPRLYERRDNRGNQLSGGEQQMLAISRSLLQNPDLLILDEPTEGLAPVVVQQIKTLLQNLVKVGNTSILLIEQSISVATAVSENISIMVHGRIEREILSSELLGNIELQKQLLGVGHATSSAIPPATNTANNMTDVPIAETRVDKTTLPDNIISLHTPAILPTKWSDARWDRVQNQQGEENSTDINISADDSIIPLYPSVTPSYDVFQHDVIYVAGTYDTKANELFYIRDCLRVQNMNVKTVDLSTIRNYHAVDIPATYVAACHPQGMEKVFSGERGSSVTQMAIAFEHWLLQQPAIGGIISAGGSGGTTLATSAMRALPIGVPKVMISTVASGDVSAYVGPNDIMMMYSVTDIQGLNYISRKVLKNGASAIAGMIKAHQAEQAVLTAIGKAQQTIDDKPAIGMTMFGVTTTAIQQISKQLEKYYDCLVFHATGVGGRSMEKLVDNGLLTAAIDLTTTELCDRQVGGVFPATDDRFGAFIRQDIPYVGSVGALDMVNFHARDTVPEKFKHRKFVIHNPQVTLMRTNKAEITEIAHWMMQRINQIKAPVRFVLPEGGVSALDAPDQPFYDPEVNEALFSIIKQEFQESNNHHLIVTPHHINAPAFTRVVVNAFNEITSQERNQSYG